MTNEDKQATVTVLKELIKPLVYVIIGVILCLIFKYACNAEKTKIEPKYNYFKQTIDSLKNLALNSDLKANQYKTKADSLSTLKPKIIIKYKVLRDSVLVYYGNDSLITGYVEYCDSLNELNTEIIKAKDSVIVNQDTRIDLDVKIIEANISEIESKQSEVKAVKKQLRKQRAKTILVGVIGALSLGTVLVLK